MHRLPSQQRTLQADGSAEYLLLERSTPQTKQLEHDRGMPVNNKVDPKKRYFCKEGTHPVAVFLKPGTDWPLTPRVTIAYRHADASPNGLWLHGVVTLVHPDGYFNVDKTGAGGR